MSLYCGSMLTPTGRSSPQAVALSRAAEVVPPRVREVLVERQPADERRPGHDPAALLGEQGEADLAAQLVVDVTADREREVDHLRLEPDDLAAQQLVRRGIVIAHAAQQLVVAFVAAVDRVGQVEKDDRRLGEERVALLLEPADLGRVGGREVDALHAALAADRVGNRTSVGLLRW